MWLQLHIAVIKMGKLNQTIELLQMAAVSVILKLFFQTTTFSKKPDVVSLGNFNLKSELDDYGVQMFRIVNFIRHPQYTLKAHYHDIALIRLTSEIKYVNTCHLESSTHFVKSSQLYCSVDKSLNGKNFCRAFISEYYRKILSI